MRPSTPLWKMNHTASILSITFVLLSTGEAFRVTRIMPGKAPALIHQLKGRLLPI
jgi:hypothetical protein